jgi:hypothetical protein
VECLERRIGYVVVDDDVVVAGWRVEALVEDVTGARDALTSYVSSGDLVSTFLLANMSRIPM